jgi:pyruvate kinase
MKVAVKILKEKNLVKTGATIIFTSGSPVEEKGKDIWIRLGKA